MSDDSHVHVRIEIIKKADQPREIGWMWHLIPLVEIRGGWHELVVIGRVCDTPEDAITDALEAAHQLGKRWHVSRCESIPHLSAVIPSVRPDSRFAQSETEQRRCSDGT